MRQIFQVLKAVSQRLSAVSDTAHLDSQVLLAHVLDRPRTWILAHPEARLSERQNRVIWAAVERLETGEPLPYVLGHWEFYALDFKISPAVLIPRPETELLVEEALTWLRAHPTRRQAADIGTGSGCIAVSLAHTIPDLQVLAMDISWSALQVAQSNFQSHGVSARIQAIQTDLLDGVGGQFDLICSNLPYIPAPDLKLLRVARSEPLLALDGGVDGLDLIRRLIARLPQRLAAGGLCLLEIESSQGEAVRRLAAQCFPDAQVQVRVDLAGKERLVRIQLA